MINTGAFYYVYRYQYLDAQRHPVVSDSLATLEYINNLPAIPLKETALRVSQRAVDPLGRFLGSDPR